MEAQFSINCFDDDEVSSKFFPNGIEARYAVNILRGKTTWFDDYSKALDYIRALVMTYDMECEAK